MTEIEAIEEIIIRAKEKMAELKPTSNPFDFADYAFCEQIVKALEVAKAKAEAWEAVTKAFDVDIEDGVCEDMLKISERKSRWVDGIGIVFGPISKEGVEAIKEALEE